MNKIKNLFLSSWHLSLQIFFWVELVLMGDYLLWILSVLTILSCCTVYWDAPNGKGGFCNVNFLLKFHLSLQIPLSKQTFVWLDKNIQYQIYWFFYSYTYCIVLKKIKYCHMWWKGRQMHLSERSRAIETITEAYNFESVFPNCMWSWLSENSGSEIFKNQVFLM